MTVTHTVISQIWQWKNSYLHHILQFCVGYSSVFFKVEPIFSDTSSGCLCRNTERSSNICFAVQPFVRKLMFQKLHSYAGTTPVKLATIFAMRFPHHKLHYETSNPISAFMETIVHAIQGEHYVEA